MADKDFDIKKEYEVLRKKHNLPDFDKINNDFELEYLEKNIFLLRAIRRRLHEKVVFFCRIIENILYHSGQSHLSAYESGFFDDEKKQKMTKIHKKLMVYERQSILIDTNPNEKGDIEFICKLSEDWRNVKEELKDIVETIENAWSSEL